MISQRKFMLSNSKHSLEKSIVNSLDGQDEALLPFLPYLLQDLWGIGASPKHLAELVKKHHLQYTIQTALDLGCGKGAVSMALAQEFGWTMTGIDAMPEFIQEAQQRAESFGIQQLCQFEVGDIRHAVSECSGYDLVILGSIGPVLGTIPETLRAIVPCLNDMGYVLLDDEYAKSPSADNFPTRSETVQQIESTSFQIRDELFYSEDFMKTSNEEIFVHIGRRAVELQEQHPEHATLFQDYVSAQAKENRVLEKYVTCVTWLLQNSQHS